MQMGELTTATQGQEPTGANRLVSMTPKELLSAFYALQEERIQTYQMFDE